MGKTTDEMTVGEIWDKLLDMGVSEETLQTVTSIHGYNKEELLDVLYVRFGYRNFEQMQ